MKTKEKIAFFEQNVLENAEKDLRAQLDSYEEKLKADYQEFVEETDQTNKERFESEANAIRKQNNKMLSELQIRYQRDLYLQVTELKDKIIAHVKERLKEYKETDAYCDQLIAIGRSIQSFAKDEKFDLYIDPSDKALLKDCEEAIGHKVIISDRPLLGGMRGVLRKRDVLIDDSFSTYLENWRENFDILGGDKR
ncbi:MAG: hypothetical protein MR008_05255 [Aerococcus sp.]|nr:hypothetical protein [Aerococcus sp.]